MKELKIQNIFLRKIRKKEEIETLEIKNNENRKMKNKRK